MSDFQQATARLQQWVTQQLKQGVSKQQLYFYLVKRDFAESMISALLDGYQPTPSTAIIEQVPEDISTDTSAKFDDPAHFFAFSHIKITQQQKMYQIRVPQMQLFVVPEVVESKLCEQLIIRSRRHFSPSLVVGQKNDQDSGRSSTTALVRDIAADAEKKLKLRFCQLMGIDPRYCEPLQIQRYEHGQLYQKHADWFDENHPGYRESMLGQGQRTWTCLLYLNDDFEGGGTHFTSTRQHITAVTGTACIWNNLHPNGDVNTDTFHEGLKVTKGTKYILTAWFRARPL